MYQQLIMSYGYESPRPVGADLGEFSESIPPRNPVRAHLVEVLSRTVPMLGRDSGVFKRHIDQVDGLMDGYELVREAREDGTVESSREEDGDSCIRVGSLGRQGHVQYAKPQ